MSSSLAENNLLLELCKTTIGFLESEDEYVKEKILKSENKTSEMINDQRLSIIKQIKMVIIKSIIIISIIFIIGVIIIKHIHKNFKIPLIIIISLLLCFFILFIIYYIYKLKSKEIELSKVFSSNKKYITELNDIYISAQQTSEISTLEQKFNSIFKDIDFYNNKYNNDNVNNFMLQNCNSLGHYLLFYNKFNFSEKQSECLTYRYNSEFAINKLNYFNNTYNSQTFVPSEVLNYVYSI